MKPLLSTFCICFFAFANLSAQVDTAWVRSHGMGTARYIALDNAGDIYVAGNSGGDICTIKYNSDGDSLWADRFESGTSDDLPCGFLVDNAGYAYVCGYGHIPNSTLVYYVIKYNTANGDTIWTARIPDMWCDDNGRLLNKIQVDNAGNVYVTGTCRGIIDTTTQEICTIKFNASGDTLWSARYLGTGNLYDRASAIAIDNTGNVYVTGASWNASIDFATIKYNSNGQQQWVATYDGPANSTDYPYAIAADNNGAVYVTGSCFTGGAVNTDFCTIKYDAATGDSLWVQRYGAPDYNVNVPSLLTVDATGDIFVCGESYAPSTATDFLLIKYDGSGNELWTARYSSVGSGEDYPHAMDFDDTGNAYIVGDSPGGFSMVKFDNTGQEIWSQFTADIAINAIAVAAPDTFYVAGKRNSDFVTMKYLPTGRVGVSPTGFTFYVQDGGSDAAVLTISNIAAPGGGNLQWSVADLEFSRQLPSTPAPAHNSNSIPSGKEQLLSTGDVIYQIPYPSGTDELNGLAWGDNALWATDVTNHQVLKMDPITGAVLFSFSIPGGFPCDLAHDGDYLWYFDYNANQIHQFDPRDGTLLGSITNPVSGGEGMTTDGRFLFRGGGDSTIFKFDVGGNVVDTIPAPDGWCQGLARDDSTIWYSSGLRLYQIDPVTGQILQTFVTPNGFADGGITFDGKFLRFSANQSHVIYSLDIGYEGDDAAWLSENPLSGTIPPGSSQNVDITVTAAGLDSGTYAADIILSSNDVSVPELVIPVELNVDVPPQGVTHPETQPFTFRLWQNYPNPFNPVTTIDFALPHATRITLHVYDIAGRKVKTLVDGNLPAGKHTVQWDGTNDAGQPVASGVYLYRLQAGNRFSQTRKMALLR